MRQKIKYVRNIAAQLRLDRMLILLIMIRAESVPLVAENFFQVRSSSGPVNHLSVCRIGLSIWRSSETARGFFVGFVFVFC